MSSFFGTGRRVGVYIFGDDKALQKTLSRSETRLKTFGKRVDGISAGGLFGRAGAAQFAGAAAFGLAITKSVKAAQEAQVVLGQTGVAVKQAGLDWARSSKQIDDAATRISKSSAFDDEDVLRSFQVFVRGQKDVGKSIDLTSLAADVARGRYTDLESATQLVNKAAMGQIGALRRAGIQIDKNATATEALAALQKTYAGAAEEYGKSSAGSVDRLSVAWENLAEVLGGPVSTALAVVAEKTVGLFGWLDKTANRLGGVTLPNVPGQTGDGTKVSNIWDFGDDTGLWEMLFGGGKKPSGPPPAFGLKPPFAFKLPKTVTTTTGNGGQPPAFGQPGFKPLNPPPPPVTGLPAGLEEKILDARLKGTDSALLAALKSGAGFLRNAIKSAKPADRMALKQVLLGINQEIDAINESAADAERQASEDRKSAARKAADARKRSVEKARKADEKIIKAHLAAAKILWEQGEKLKDAALEKLDALQESRDTNRDLADAKDKFRLAKMIGGKRTVLEARRGLEDAQLARKRHLLEGATVMPSGNNAAAGFTVHIGTLTLTGINNPAELQAALIKQSKKNATQRRGRNGGV